MDADRSIPPIRLRVRLGSTGFDTLVWDEHTGAILPVGSVTITTKMDGDINMMTMRNVPISLEADVPNPFYPKRESL